MFFSQRPTTSYKVRKQPLEPFVVEPSPAPTPSPTPQNRKQHPPLPRQTFHPCSSGNVRADEGSQGTWHLRKPCLKSSPRSLTEPTEGWWCAAYWRLWLTHCTSPSLIQPSQKLPQLRKAPDPVRSSSTAISGQWRWHALLGGRNGCRTPDHFYTECRMLMELGFSFKNILF